MALPRYKGGIGVGLWKKIRKEEPLKRNISCLVSNGRKVKFWRDNWCNGEALCNSFPSLNILANSKDVRVAEIWIQQAWPMV